LSQTAQGFPGSLQQSKQNRFIVTSAFATSFASLPRLSQLLRIEPQSQFAHCLLDMTLALVVPQPVNMPGRHNTELDEIRSLSRYCFLLLSKDCLSAFYFVSGSSRSNSCIWFPSSVSLVLLPGLPMDPIRTLSPRNTITQLLPGTIPPGNTGPKSDHTWKHPSRVVNQTKICIINLMWLQSSQMASISPTKCFFKNDQQQTKPWMETAGLLDCFLYFS